MPPEKRLTSTTTITPASFLNLRLCLFVVLSFTWNASGGPHHPSDWTLHDGFENYYKNTLSIVAGACLGMFYLWPMMALQLGVGKPSFWFFKLGAYVVLGVAMVILGNIPGLDLQIG